jgi:hypothetical protein
MVADNYCSVILLWNRIILSTCDPHSLIEFHALNVFGLLPLPTSSILQVHIDVFTSTLQVLLNWFGFSGIDLASLKIGSENWKDMNWFGFSKIWMWKLEGHEQTLSNQVTPPAYHFYVQFCCHYAKSSTIAYSVGYMVWWVHEKDPILLISGRS